MLKMYLVIALRGLVRNMVYAATNILGLAIGIACCIAIMMYVENEVSFDRYHEHADRVFRVVADINVPGRTISPSGVATPVAPALKADIPGIETAVRLFSPNIFGQPVISVEDHSFRESGLMFADSGVFDVFTLPFIRGSRERALHRPQTVVLTEFTAHRYFGAEDPMGKVVKLDGSLPLTVTGVIRDLPENTHLGFTMLVSMSTAETMYPVLLSAWNSPLMHSYVLLAPHASAAEIAGHFPAFVKKYIGEKYFQRIYHLEPLKDIHLYSSRAGGMRPPGSIAEVSLFSVVGLFIMGIAIVNFVNLTTALATKRAKEVGMRKVLGAARIDLIRQFIGESTLMVAAAVLLALLLVEIGRPLFGSLSGRELHFLTIPAWEAGVIIFVMTLLVGFVAGIYPSLYLSRFAPVEVFRKGNGAKGGFRRALVVFQFIASGTLILCTLVVRDQLSFVQNAKLGFDEEHIVIVPFGITEAGERIEAIRAQLMKSAHIAGVTAMFGTPGVGLPGMDYWVDGMQTGSSSNYVTLLTDPDFPATYGVTMAEGRFLSRDFTTDPEHAFVINETAARELQWEHPLGKTIHWLQPGPSGNEVVKDGTVVGVVRDFHYGSMHGQIQPMIIHSWPDWQAFNTLAIRMRSRDVAETLGFIESTLHDLTPGRPSDWYFLDDAIHNAYQADQRFGAVFAAFATLAIVIACLGLFGLASFTAERRTKEIGIRRVLGAAVPGIVGLLSGEFLLLVLIANAIALPAGFLIAQDWLNDFAYKVSIGWYCFVIPLCASLLIALLTVSIQAIRAALSDPVVALRYE
jgi:putative ABC transport system permease protein